MSTDYIPLQDIRFSDLFDGRLESFEVREAVTEETTPSARFLTDGTNYLWAYRNSDGALAGFTRRGLVNPRKILQAIRSAFAVEIVSEHQPQFWGFATREEWDAAMETQAAEDRDRFYEQVMRYVRGEDHGLKPGTDGMIQANIAKALMADHPDLALPESKETLLQATESAYDRDYARRVTLTPDEIALVRHFASHEDDRPKG